MAGDSVLLVKNTYLGTAWQGVTVVGPAASHQYDGLSHRVIAKPRAIMTF